MLELRDLEANETHGWTGLQDDERAASAPDSPAPVADHAERREAALVVDERARDEAPEEP